MGQERKNSILLLALGNDILGDDGVAFHAARQLRLGFTGIDVVETGEAGLALLEIMEGYRRVLLLDSTVTGLHKAGTVLRFSPGDFRSIKAPSPHYAGLPEVLELARRLQIDFPAEFVILAMEVKDPFTIQEKLTPEVRQALPEYVAAAEGLLDCWTRIEAAEDASVSYGL